ncbi:MAG: peptidylprolyl isomerase [Spirochaetota bacterium]
MKKKLLAIAALCAAIAVSCKGKVTYDLEAPGILLQSGSLSLPTRVFQSMFDVMRKSRIKEGQDVRSALFMVVADHYLAAEYLKRHSANPDSAVTAETRKIYYETLSYYLNDRNLQPVFRQWIKSITIPQVSELRALFDEKAEAAYTNVPLRRALADKRVLARYGETGGTILTYSRLFDSLPHAGQLHLFTSPDRRSLEQLVMTQLRYEFLDEYTAKAAEPEKSEYSALKQLVANSVYSRNLRYEMGMENANPHAENSAVKQRAKSVSLSKVKEYYAANKDKYKEVQSIDCRHIQLKDYDQAINLRDKIDQGADMVALVKKYSLAPDKNNPDPGLISGIKNDTELHKRPRIETLCMMPKQGESEVVRDGDFFHVVKAERRTDGYPPLDETTHLKDDIAREIAAQELRAEFETYKKKVLGRVDIRINKSELEKLK